MSEHGFTRRATLAALCAVGLQFAFGAREFSINEGEVKHFLKLNFSLLLILWDKVDVFLCVLKHDVQAIKRYALRICDFRKSDAFNLFDLSINGRQRY